MKKILHYFFAFLLLLSVTVSCEKEKSVEKESINRVSQFVYDGLSVYYLWADDMVDKEPGSTDSDPEKYFERVLHPIDKWSWFTDDVEELLAEFVGEVTGAFGFEPIIGQTQSKKYLAVIRYVFPNTPAAEAGLKRGDIIDKINGQDISQSNYTLLYGAKTTVEFTVHDQNYENPQEIPLTPRNIEKNPVLFSKVYDKNQINDLDNKKIGYLFYTNFISKYNNDLYNVFTEFKNAGITDLVLDLRYNTGGDISSAIYLSSLIAPKEHVQKKVPFVTLLTNALLTKHGWSDTDSLGYYNKKTEQDPLNANLDLNKVYIIATSGSYSASELVTFCLDSYMDVVHIGEKTGGKYTASITIHGYNSFSKNGQPRAATVYVEKELSASEKNELKNWGMQPIIARYTNKDGEDFINTDGLIPDADNIIASLENAPRTWKPIGDPDDYLFAKAISLITERPYTQIDPYALKSARQEIFIDARISSPTDKIFKEAVILDKVPGIINNR